MEHKKIIPINSLDELKSGSIDRENNIPALATQGSDDWQRLFSGKNLEATGDVLDYLNTDLGSQTYIVGSSVWTPGISAYKKRDIDILSVSPNSINHPECSQLYSLLVELGGLQGAQENPLGWLSKFLMKNSKNEPSIYSTSLSRRFLFEVEGTHYLSGSYSGVEKIEGRYSLKPLFEESRTIDITFSDESEFKKSQEIGVWVK